AGFTQYDANLAALQAVLAEWTSARSYNDRVANLSGAGTGVRLNGAFFLNDSTVMDDGQVDELTGGDGQDWFLLNLDPAAADDAKDRRNTEYTYDVDLWSGTWLG